MENTREIRSRIKSINETRQITKAMKLISVAKLRKARQQLESTLPYFNKIKSVIAEILARSANISNIYLNQPEIADSAKRSGYLVLSGDKGLAGGYNNNILKLAEGHIKDNSRTSALFIAGQTGRAYFRKKGYAMHPDFDYPVQDPTIMRAREMAEIILDLYNKGQLNEVYLIYTLTITTINLRPTATKLLPLDLATLRKELKVDETGPVKQDESLVYEPSAQTVFDILIRQYLKGVIYGALVEAFTSEQSARMTAMDNATLSADEMLQRLNLRYNRARQASITREISEIVGGAAVLH